MTISLAWCCPVSITAGSLWKCSLSSSSTEVSINFWGFMKSVWTKLECYCPIFSLIKNFLASKVINEIGLFSYDSPIAPKVMISGKSWANDFIRIFSSVKKIVESLPSWAHLVSPGKPGLDRICVNNSLSKYSWSLKIYLIGISSPFYGFPEF